MTFGIFLVVGFAVGMVTQTLRGVRIELQRIANELGFHNTLTRRLEERLTYWEQRDRRRSHG